MSDFNAFIRQLKERNDIVEVIGSYIKLERRGYQYWACCPFHHEKTPSFAINTAEGYYHCFGCGVSGDVIGFVKEYENVDFMQAVGILAARAGLEIPARDEKSMEEASLKKKKRDRLVLLMKDAARFYLGNLYSGRADKHLGYLSKRQISPSVAKKFGLGASIDYGGLPSHLLSAGYTPEECIESGSCVRTEEGGLIDSLGGRLIIPIINHMDEVVAFGGRVMQPTDHAKYKNTRETMLFNKSKNLFNMNLVKKEKRAGGLSSLIMVEGYMDAISLYAAGFRNVVASMGTSLTREQARLCKRYSDNVFISYDGDFAGQKANLRGLDILKDEGIRVRVVPMPEGLDPDDVIKSSGAEGYSACLEKAMPLIDFRILYVLRQFDLKKTDEVREFVKEVLPIVREAESETEREELLRRVSELSGVSLGALQRDMERIPEAKREPPPFTAEKQESREGKDGVISASRRVLCACLHSAPYALGCDLSEIEWENPVFSAVAEYITEARKKGGVRVSGIFEALQQSDELDAILQEYAELEGETAERYFHGCVNTLRRDSLLKKKRRAQAQLAGAPPEKLRLLIEEIGRIDRKMKNIGGGKA